MWPGIVIKIVPGTTQRKIIIMEQKPSFLGVFWKIVYKFARNRRKLDDIGEAQTM